MEFAEARALAEAALAGAEGQEETCYPPAAEHLTAARERLGLSKPQLDLRLGSPGRLCPDLELRDDELFQCASIAQLVRLADVLETSVAALLFGGDPSTPLSIVTCADVARHIREAVAAEGTTVEGFGTRVGWHLEPVLSDPSALTSYNVQGLRDICHGVGIDWMAVVSALERKGRPTKDWS